MEQLWILVLVALCLVAQTLAAWSLGFHFGQKSVKMVGTKTETIQVNERMTVQRTIPEQEKPTVNYAKPEGQRFAVPPQWRQAVAEMEGKEDN